MRVMGDEGGHGCIKVPGPCGPKVLVHGNRAGNQHESAPNSAFVISVNTIIIRIVFSGLEFWQAAGLHQVSCNQNKDAG